MHVVIVGGGVAGITAAQRLRALAPTASLTLVDAEPYPYYIRPGLIDILAGRKGLPDITPHNREWYEQQEITYRTSAHVVGLDTAGHRAQLSSGEEFPYDRVLLATGAQAFCPPFPGADQSGVFTLRSAEDAEQIVAKAAESKHAAVVGGGWLGLEVARALALRGLQASVVEREPWLLPGQLDREGAGVLSALLEAQGVRVLTGIDEVAIPEKGYLRAVDNGRAETLFAELVVVAAGIRCRTDMARRSGADVRHGVLVDDWLATSVPGVYAAGDVAEWRGRVYGIIPAARDQAHAAAANIVEHGALRYEGSTPLNTLKVAGVDLAVLGDAQPRGGPGDEVRHVDPAAGVYRKLVLEGDSRLLRAVLLGDREGVGVLQAAIRSGESLSGRVQRFLSGDYRAYAR